MRCLSFLLVFAHSITPGLAEEVKESQVCAESITSALALLSFSSSDTTPNACTNLFRTYSIYAAIKLYCPEPEIKPGIEQINKHCTGEQSRLPYAEIEPDLTDSYLRLLRVVDFQEVPADEELEEPVLISKTYFDTYYKTIVRHMFCSSPFYLPYRWVRRSQDRLTKY
jgi:hypothetical protein